MKVVLAGVIAVLLQGCTVLAVADLAVSAGVTVVKTGVAVTGAAVNVAAAGVGAMLPDDEDDKPSARQ